MPLSQFEAEHAAVEGDRTVQIGDLQVNVSDAGLRVNRAAIRAAPFRRCHISLHPCVTWRCQYCVPRVLPCVHHFIIPCPLAAIQDTTSPPSRRTGSALPCRGAAYLRRSRSRGAGTVRPSSGTAKRTWNGSG